MLNIPLIGIAAGLVLCAVIAKLLTRGQDKATKSDKAEIMRQLLAKAEGETAIPTKTPPIRSRVPAPTQNKPAIIGPRPKPHPAIPAMRSK